METVHVSTYCVPGSYGSILQALGLKRALAELGFASRIHQIVPPPGKNYRIPCRSLTRGNLKLALQKALVYPRLQRRHRETYRFLEEHLDLAYYRDLDAMGEALKGEKLFLAGSDQIWHPEKLAPEFFLDFAPAGARKLSYAASMGVLDVPKDKEGEFRRLIRNFDTLSARETDCAAVVADFAEKEVRVHIDPTFLCDAEVWRGLRRPYQVARPYILVYPLYWDAGLNVQLRQLRERTGKDIVVISDHHRKIYVNQWVLDADPGQFLWLLDHADGVVTSSFHGVAMALQFGRPVAPVINPAAPSRIRNLLEVLNYSEVDITGLAEGDFDFSAVNARIAAERQRGKAYLREILSRDGGDR